MTYVELFITSLQVIFWFLMVRIAIRCMMIQTKLQQELRDMREQSYFNNEYEGYEDDLSSPEEDEFADYWRGSDN